jgi:hypothetical protein
MNSYDLMVGIPIEESVQLEDYELNGRVTLDGS